MEDRDTGRNGRAYGGNVSRRRAGINPRCKENGRLLTAFVGNVAGNREMRPVRKDSVAVKVQITLCVPRVRLGAVCL